MRFAVFLFVVAGVTACSHRSDQLDTSTVASTQHDTTLLIVEPPNQTFTIQSPPPRLRRPFDHKKLSVIAMHSINSFFLVDGEEQGLEYELLQLYAKDRGLSIDIETVENYREMYDSIASGNFDLVMGTLFINAAMDSIIPFSKPLYYADVVMVSTEKIKESQKAESIGVIHHSPVHFWIHERDSIMNNMKDSIEHLGTDLSRELALERVANNTMSRLIVDRNEFLIMHAFFPQLREHAIIQRRQPIAFAFNRYSMSLQDNFNDWYESHHKSRDYQYVIKKYQDHSAFMKEKLRYEIPAIRQGVISHYDSIIKRHAKLHDFDWKLIAAIIHQESRFRPTIVSPVGAYGLMQLMPSVATTYHINFKTLSSPTLNIGTGTKYFRWIYNHFDKPEYAADDKIKFSLAAYNAGMGHVLDAKALAAKYHLNPYVWDENVEAMLLKKGTREFYSDPVVKFGHCRGFETQVYVRNIMQYYEHYRNFLPVESL
ncbi:MAG TPA: transglycosylase SLT domain-containing protein [Chryseolinea sp.]|nr:transglycosylase SLT domain-containing protein [Chryseolinea sp.]